MFAVILLGIGFIMLAGIFPVAIQQTQQSSDDVTAIGVIQGAIPVLQERIGQANVYTGNVDGTMEPLTGNLATADAPRNAQILALWQSVRGNMIQPHDQRFGWAAFIRRTAGYPQATIITIAVQNRTRSPYTSVDLVNSPDSVGAAPNPLNLATFEPKPVRVWTVEGRKGSFGLHNPDIIYFLKPSGSEVDYRPAIAEGTFVVIAEAPGFSLINGRYYRVSVRRPELDDQTAKSEAWELMPGYDMPSGFGKNGTDDNGSGDDLNESFPPGLGWGAPPSGAGARAYVIGRATRDPERPFNDTAGQNFNPFEGPTQDVAIYKTVIPVQ
jgi:hypothetical protein